jgi:membrane associated rhomboid family serine protease
MFPIRDHNPSGRTPYVVYALISINIVVYIATWNLMSDDRSAYYFLAEWALVPERISSLRGFETLITTQFMHGGFMHLAGNMLFLWIFGDNLEDEMGHFGFLAFYLACGIGAAAIQVVSAPHSQIPTVGASGAIAGVMGGYLLMFPKAKVDILLILIVFFRVFAIPAWVALLIWLGMQVFGSAGADPASGGIAYWAHIGGFAVGLVLTIPLWLKRGGPSFWGRTHGHPPHPEHMYKYSPSRIPRVPRK